MAFFVGNLSRSKGHPPHVAGASRPGQRPIRTRLPESGFRVAGSGWQIRVAPFAPTNSAAARFIKSAALDLNAGNRFFVEMPQPRSNQPAHPTPPVPVWDRRWMLALGCALFAGGIFAAYHNTFHVPFLLDDFDAIGKNRTIRSFATAFFPPTNSGATVSGRPLLNFSLAINYHLGGTAVFGYHLGNILIHVLAGLTLFGVIRRTLKLPGLQDRFGAHATPLAWFAALLWAVHPLQTESVTYIIQRAESLVWKAVLAGAVGAGGGPYMKQVEQ